MGRACLTADFLSEMYNDRPTEQVTCWGKNYSHIIPPHALQQP